MECAARAAKYNTEQEEKLKIDEDDVPLALIFGKGGDHVVGGQCVPAAAGGASSSGAASSGGAASSSGASSKDEPIQGRGRISKLDSWSVLDEKGGVLGFIVWNVKVGSLALKPENACFWNTSLDSCRMAACSF